MMKKLKDRICAGIFAVLLSVCIVASGSVICAKAGSIAGDAEASEVTLELNRRNPEENLPFQMTNLFPGDSETRYYRLKVSYTGTITVFFQAKPNEGDEKLGAVLKAKVRLLNTDEVLYEGSIAEMPELESELTTDKKAQTDELCYEITVSLGTEVGNEFQNKTLTAALNWWAEGSESGITDSAEDETADSTEDGAADSGEEETTDSTEGETSDSEAGGSGSGGIGSGGELVDPPYTGDHNLTILWIGCACAAVVVMTLTVTGKRRMVIAGTVQKEEAGQQIGRKRKKSAWLGMLPMIIVLMAFGITSLALVYQKVNMEGNLFATGKVSICLNDNQPVFDEEILFEPGMVIKKDFTLRNDSSCEVYYRLYFSDIVGDFAKVLKVSVSDGETVIFDGTLAELNGVKSEGANGQLKVSEERTLTITFEVPEDGTNIIQGTTALFDLNAEAVQVVNNPGGMFE